MDKMAEPCDVGNKNGAAKQRRRQRRTSPSGPSSLRREDSSPTPRAPPKSHHPLRSPLPAPQRALRLASERGCRALTKALTPSTPRRGHPRSSPGYTRHARPRSQRTPSRREKKKKKPKCKELSPNAHFLHRVCELQHLLLYCARRSHGPPPGPRSDSAPRHSAYSPVSKTPLWCLGQEILPVSSRIFLNRR